MTGTSFSRNTWLNSLHMTTLTVSLLEAEGHECDSILEGSGITAAGLPVNGARAKASIWTNSIRINTLPSRTPRL